MKVLIMCSTIVAAFVCSSLLMTIDSANILCVFPFPALSHQIVYQPIWKELSHRGHEVTVLTTHPTKNVSLKNLHEIDISFLESLVMEKHNFTKIVSTEKNLNVLLNSFLSMSNDVTEEFFKNSEVQNLVHSGLKFDIILGELVFPSWFALSEIFNCPLVLINSMPTSLVGHDSVGNPSHPVLYADFNLPFGPTLNFVERLISVAYSIYIRYVMIYRHYPEQLEISKKYLGENTINLMDIQNKVALIFTSTVPGFHPARPVVPTYIELFGLHMKPAEDLPLDLKEYMDTARDGVIYMSFGSAVKSHLLPQKTIKIFLKVFSQLPYKILWKYEDDMPEKSQNVRISSWYPQQDILRHPNLKLFITHGGLQSIIEAIYNGVPLIGIPFFGDQFYNTLRFDPLGMGTSLDKDDLNADVLKNAIVEIIGNPKYRFKMKALADLAVDQPIKPLDKAIWWIEYVIRHKGTKHLRNAAVDMPFYQYFLLDVLAFVLLFTSALIYIFEKIARITFNLIRILLVCVYEGSRAKVKTD